MIDNPRTKRILFWCMFVGFILLDQMVKLLVRRTLVEGQSLAIPWPGKFEIELTFNQGIAFGKFQGKGTWFSPIAVLIAGGAVWHMIKHPEESRWNHMAYGLLSAGALGNMIDRLVFQRVTDMFYFKAINFPVFNVADSCITVATIMLILGWWFEASHKKVPAGETLPVEAK